MIKLEAWSDAAEAQLLRATSPKMLPILRADVQAGGATQLWHCQDESSDCYIMTRLEQSPLEWCFVACAGHGAMKHARVFVAEGRRRGWSMRCHVVKGSLARFWGRLGFEDSERVLRIAVSK